jgi:cardiolipin synthase
VAEFPAQIREAQERRLRERAERRIVTVPNVISLLRLVVLMPLFVVALLAWHSPGGALIVAIVLGGTDYLDGYIARRFHQVTLLGRALDPIADRISQIVVSATLVIGGYLPLWMAAVVLVSDLILASTILVRERRAAIPVRWIGRIRTAILMVGLPFVLFAAWVAPDNGVLRFVAVAIVGVGVVLHAIADLLYAISIARRTADSVRDAHPDSD